MPLSSTVFFVARKIDENFRSMLVRQRDLRDRGSSIAAPPESNRPVLQLDCWSYPASLSQVGYRRCSAFPGPVVLRSDDKAAGHRAPREPGEVLSAGRSFSTRPTGS